MSIEIKKASKDDAKRLLDYRLAFVLETSGKEMSDDFKHYTLKHLQENLDTNSLISYMAEDNSKIVATVILAIYDVMPKLYNSNGRVGYIFNVSTLNEYRGNGLASKLLKIVMDEAKNLEVKEIYLNAEPSAVNLYKSLGFNIVEHEMVIRFGSNLLN